LGIKGGSGVTKKVLIIGGVACGAKTAARLMRIDSEAKRLGFGNIALLEGGTLAL